MGIAAAAIDATVITATCAVIIANILSRQLSRAELKLVSEGAPHATQRHILTPSFEIDQELT
jgi:hypothetical protein